MVMLTHDESPMSYSFSSMCSTNSLLEAIQPYASDMSFHFVFFCDGLSPFGGSFRLKLGYLICTLSTFA
jgi:hypothetical protein